MLFYRSYPTVVGVGSLKTKELKLSTDGSEYMFSSYLFMENTWTAGPYPIKLVRRQRKGHAH